MKFRLLAAAGAILLILAFFLKNNEKADAYSVSKDLSEAQTHSGIDPKEPKDKPVGKTIAKPVKKARIVIEQPLQIVVEQSYQPKNLESEEKVELGEVVKEGDKDAESSLANPWVVHNISSQGSQCSTEEPCVPTGREGVLLVGASLLPQRQLFPWQGVVELGQYEQRTPLIHLR